MTNRKPVIVEEDKLIMDERVVRNWCSRETGEDVFIIEQLVIPTLHMRYRPNPTVEYLIGGLIVFMVMAYAVRTLLGQ